MSQADHEEGEFSPAEELANIVSSFRAYLEWSQDVGTTGLPRDPQAKAKALAIAAELGPIQKQSLSLPKEAPAAAQRTVQTPTARTPSPEFSAPATQNSAPLEKNSGGLKKAEFQVPSFEDKPQQSKPTSKIQPKAVAKKHWDLPDDIANLNAPELQKRLDSLCDCPQHAGSLAPIILRGSAASGLCFVADTTSAEDISEESPFLGEAGELLDRMLKGMGLAQDEAAVLLLTKCRPCAGVAPAKDHELSFLPYLHRYLQLMRPKVIVTLGANTTNALLGTQMPISKLRGQFRLYAGKTALMPTFHPAYLLKAPSAKRDVWFDLKQVLQHLGRDIPVSK